MKRSLPDILTDDEERRLLAAFNPRYLTGARNRLMIRMALETGMRIGDLISLDWKDIDKAELRVHLKNGKGKKDRVVWFKPSLLLDLEKYADRWNDHVGLAFKTSKGGPIQSQYLRRMIGERAKKAGIEKRIYFHLLRHTYLSKLYSRTKDIRIVQEVAGHSDISTTMIYTHVSGEDIRAAMIGDEPIEAPETEPTPELSPAQMNAVIAEMQRRGLIAAAPSMSKPSPEIVEPDPEEADAVAEMLNRALRPVSRPNEGKAK